MNQRRFFGNDFFYKKFAYSASVKVRNQRILGLNIGFGRSPTSVFEFGLKKSDSKIARWYRLALLAAVANAKIFVQKITASFKMNLKADGPDCKIIFKFGSRVERLHSARKQGRRIYNVCICKQCVCLYKHHLRCKILVGNTQTLELHPLDAGLASPNEKVYGSNTLSAIGKQLFSVKKENSDD